MIKQVINDKGTIELISYKENKMGWSVVDALKRKDM